MINFLTLCTVAAVAALLGALLHLPKEPTIAIVVIGVLFTVIWLFDPLRFDD
jgi:hypothetical protein